MARPRQIAEIADDFLLRLRAVLDADRHDTTGAGDALTATVLFGLLNDIPIDDAVRLGVTAASLPGFLQSPGELKTLVQQSAGRPLDKDDEGRTVAQITAMALAIALARQGWTVDTSPGAQVSFQREENQIEPFVAAAKLASGEMPASAWQAFCEQVGIADLALVAEG